MTDYTAFYKWLTTYETPDMIMERGRIQGGSIDGFAELIPSSLVSTIGDVMRTAIGEYNATCVDKPGHDKDGDSVVLKCALLPTPCEHAVWGNDMIDITYRFKDEFYGNREASLKIESDILPLVQKGFSELCASNPIIVMPTIEARVTTGTTLQLCLVRLGLMGKDPPKKPITPTEETQV